MGTFSVSPTFIDYSAGSPWSSLGANQAAAQAAITQVCTDYSNGLATAGANFSCVVQCGLGAAGIGQGDTVGQAIAAGAGSFRYLSQNPLYSAWKPMLQGMPSQNALQSQAYGFLPSSPPDPSWNTGVNGVPAAVWMAVGNTTYVNGSVVGSAGMAAGFATNYNQNGLGAASVYGVFSHEISEILGRFASWQLNVGFYPMNLFIFNAVGVIVSGTGNRWFSYDNGNTNVATLNLSGNTGGSDAGDINTLGNDAYDFSGPSTASVSRSSTIPLQQRDWQIMTTIGFPLTSLGMQWAGISAPGLVGRSVAAMRGHG